MPKNDAIAPYTRGFLVILSLLSRIPLPVLPADAYTTAARHVWAYPLVGLVLGAIAIVIGEFAEALGLLPELAAGVVLLLMMLLTGAMHEDGLADTADGFWGAFEPERRLEIMKDSQIGSYGTLALIVVTGLRWVSLAALIVVAPWSYLGAAALSRSVLPLMMAYTAQARRNGLSHSVGRPTKPAAWATVGIGAVLTFIFCGATVWIVLPLALVTVWAIRAMSMRKIGGQTGDILGATQQLVETATLVVLASIAI